MLILDDNLHHCEPWVTGVIHIGGAGVALGYYEVPPMTSDCLR
jgi:non-ribosomal peptide synthetase component F